MALTSHQIESITAKTGQTFKEVADRYGHMPAGFVRRDSLVASAAPKNSR